jgi:hypothetical protein
MGAVLPREHRAYLDLSERRICRTDYPAFQSSSVSILVPSSQAHLIFR